MRKLVFLTGFLFGCAGAGRDTKPSSVRSTTEAQTTEAQSMAPTRLQVVLVRATPPRIDPPWVASPREAPGRTAHRRYPRRRAVARPKALSQPLRKLKLTPKLQKLIRALKAQGRRVFPFSRLVKRFVPDLKDDELPEKGSVTVIEVKKKFMLGALVEVLPKGYQRCSESNSEEAKIGFFTVKEQVDGEVISWTEVRSEAFTGKAIKVIFPKVFPKVPMFLIQHELPGGKCKASSAGDARTAKVVELYGIDEGNITLHETFELSSKQDKPGCEEETKTKLTWVLGRVPNKHYLIVTKVDITVHVETSGEVEGKRYECSRSTEVHKLNSSGEMSKIDEDEIKALGAKEPALRRLPKDVEGNTRAKCEAL